MAIIAVNNWAQGANALVQHEIVEITGAGATRTITQAWTSTGIQTWNQANTAYASYYVNVDIDPTKEYIIGLRDLTNVRSATYVINAMEAYTASASNISNTIWNAGTRTLTTTDGVKKNQSLSNFMFLMVDDTNLLPATGKTVSAFRSIDGAEFDPCNTATATEIGNATTGMYKIDLAASDTNGDTITLRFTATNCLDRLVTLKTNT